MIKYVIPFYYTFLTRTKGKSRKISYFLTFIIPLFIILLTYYGPERSNIFNFLLALLGTMSIYEVGYLENDLRTTKREKNPTMRVEGDNYRFLDENLLKIVILKYFFSMIVVVYLVAGTSLNVRRYVILLIMLQALYLLHNRIRNRYNLITFMLLSHLRHILPISLFLGPFLEVNILIFFSITCLRVIEKASEEKYRVTFLKVIRSDLNKYRVFYYIFLITLCAIVLKKVEVLLIYLLFYRSLILISYKKG